MHQSHTERAKPIGAVVPHNDGTVMPSAHRPGDHAGPAAQPTVAGGVETPRAGVSGADTTTRWPCAVGLSEHLGVARVGDTHVRCGAIRAVPRAELWWAFEEPMGV